nr:glycosyltransferase family 4 protein [uncultured Roseovarius sp.]
MSTDGKSICLFVGTLKPGGAERVMSWLANQLVNTGHEVTLITMAECGADFFFLDPAIRRIGLGLEKRNHVLLKPFANIQRILGLRAVVRHQKANRMVAFMPHESILAVLATRGTGCRAMISERSAPWKRDPGAIWKLLRRCFYRFADGHVAQTTAAANWLETKMGATNVHVIPNPVQLPIRSAPPVVAPEAYLSEGRRCVLAMGSRPHLKGFDLLARAFARLAKEHPDWDLAIPGLTLDFAEDSAACKDLQATLAQPELTGRVHLPGRVGNPGDWFRASDAFVLSSRTEGFPNVLIEAMAHGCAVAAFDCDTGPRDIVRDGVDGLLVADGDVDALTEAIEKIIDDPELRERMGAAALDVADRFSEERVLALWQEALA